MRTRSVVALLACTALLAGCGGPGGETAPNVPPLVSVSTTPTESPTPTPTETPGGTPPTSKVADTLCVRMSPTLVQKTLGVPVVEIQPKQVPAEFGFPTYDMCQLRLSTSPSGPVLRVGIAVFEATPLDLAAARKAYDATKGEPAKATTVGGRAGFGTSSFVVFLLGDKLVKIAGPPATLPKYVVLAQDAAQQADGLPAALPFITRPECERGTNAAANVMGGEARIRRDSETDAGDIVCGWITKTRVLYSTVRHVADANAVIAPIRKAATSFPLPLGDETYVDTATGRSIIRVGPGKLIDLVPLPAGTTDKDNMVAFTLKISGLYTR